MSFSIGHLLAFNWSAGILSPIFEHVPSLDRETHPQKLSDTRVVLFADPLQAGKATLAKKVVEARATFPTLDDPSVLNAAKDDPVGFVRGLDRATIDEIQRAPVAGGCSRARIPRNLSGPQLFLRPIVTRGHLTVPREVTP